MLWKFRKIPLLDPEGGQSKNYTFGPKQEILFFPIQFQVYWSLLSSNPAVFFTLSTVFWRVGDLLISSRSAESVTICGKRICTTFQLGQPPELLGFWRLSACISFGIYLRPFLGPKDSELDFQHDSSTFWWSHLSTLSRPLDHN